MYTNLQYNILLLFVLIVAMPAVSQKKVKLEQAKVQSGGVLPNGIRFDKWRGDVIFSHEQTRINCDSAIRYNNTNLIEAFGHILIEEGDSITITAQKLIYDGNAKIAKLRNDVVFTKLAQVTLYTDFLDYERIKQQAYYFNKGKLVDSTNTLTSVKGYYNTQSNLASFKTNVVGQNPDYKLKSDTLQYNVKTNVIYFRAFTTLTDKEGNVFNYEEGDYDTKRKKSVFNRGLLETESYELTGDRLILDDIKRYYRAISNVFLIAKEEDIIINGDYGEYWRDRQLTKVYGNALMRQITDGDTLFLTADTLVSIDSDLDADKRLLAYNNVRIYKSDLQGKSDSLSYFLADSTIYFYNDPVLWTDGNQLTADSINIQISNNQINKLNMNVNSFVISQDTVLNFNQIKGRSMTANFDNNQISKILVNGNGESIYFALEDVSNNLIGMNNILCSDMSINFSNNQVNNIVFYVKPDGKLIPPHELKEPDKLLNGFKWREDQRPLKEEMKVHQVQNLPVTPILPQEKIKSKEEIPDNAVKKNEVRFIKKEAIKDVKLKKKKSKKKKIDKHIE